VAKSPQEFLRLFRMSEPQIAYSARPDATPETELSTLANVYRYTLKCADRNAAGVTITNGGDAKAERSENDSSARTIIPDR
jgi:hypothetical protein